MPLLNDIIARPDTKWVLATFSVMGALNLASRMNTVHAGGGALGVAMAFVGIGGWIHGIASVARSAQQTNGKRSFAALMTVFFLGGCVLAMPWHFFMFRDPAAGHPILYAAVQVVLALLYVLARLILPPDRRSWYLRHLILGYATFSCLFQSVSPKLSEDTLISSLGLDLTMAFVGSTFLIFVVILVDCCCIILERTIDAPVLPANRRGHFNLASARSASFGRTKTGGRPPMRLAAKLEDLEYYRPVWSSGNSVPSPLLFCKNSDLRRALDWAQENLPGEAVEVVTIEPLSPKKRKRFQQQGVRTYDLGRPPSPQAHSCIVFGQGGRRIGRRLAQHGVRHFFFAEAPGYRPVKFCETYLTDHEPELQALFDLLEDRESRSILAACVKHRITGDHGWLRISDYAEYEHPLVRPTRGEWVMDCGAADGATAMRFAQMVGRRGRVLAIEPDPANQDRIAETMAARSRWSRAAGVETLPCGLSDAPGVARFTPDGGSGAFQDNGQIEVRLDTIDRLAAAHDVSGPGTISIDIEGFEHAALLGGLATIKRLRPKLQISIYHKPRDLFEIGLWLSRELDNYAFFMGHHDTSHCETDLYAVPREKL